MWWRWYWMYPKPSVKYQPFGLSRCTKELQLDSETIVSGGWTPHWGLAKQTIHRKVTVTIHVPCTVCTKERRIITPLCRLSRIKSPNNARPSSHSPSTRDVRQPRWKFLPGKAYYQGVMEEESQHLTAFITLWGLFEWVTIPLGFITVWVIWGWNCNIVSWWRNCF